MQKNQQLVKTEQTALMLRQQIPESCRHLLNSIKKGDILQIQANVSQYIERGVVQFDKVLSISAHARIPNLTHVYGLEGIHGILTVLLTRFNDSLNLIRPMNSEQVVECAYDLMLTTEEDQLAIEDFVIFFKGAREGKYGRILDRLDSQTVFTLFEEYRQERWKTLQKIREDKHLQLKGTGPADRTNEPDPVSTAMLNYAGKLEDLRQKLKEQREINKIDTWKKGS